MKPLEAIFWLGTAGVLYMAANNIVKNVAKDVVKDVFKETGKFSDLAVPSGGNSQSVSAPKMLALAS